MKADTERKKLYSAKLHEKGKQLHVHVSKEARKKTGLTARAILANRGDSAKIMRGSNKGKSAKVARLSYGKGAIYLEGIAHKNAKGTEVLIAFQPSNLMLTDLNMSKERKEKFNLTEGRQPVAAPVAKPVQATAQAVKTPVAVPAVSGAKPAAVQAVAKPTGGAASVAPKVQAAAKPAVQQKS